jgi:hypothetical protein
MLNTARQLMSLHSFTTKLISGMAVGACVFGLSGCQSVSSMASRSQVRIIDVSPDAPEVDVYQNSSVLASRLSFGTVTSYVPVEPGTYKTRAAVTGTRQTLVSSKAKLSAGQYTVLIGNYNSNLQQTLLKDQSHPAPAGQIALRFVDQAMRSRPVEVFLVPAGQRASSVKPVVTGLSFGSNTGYLNRPAGIYTLEVIPVGGTEPAYTGAQVTYAGGSASTVVLVDHQEEDGVQAILLEDYVPPSE